MSEKNLRVAVVAANGRVGQLVVEEATRRGMDVTAVVRGENKTAAEKSLVKDALELTAADLGGFDAVVDAAGGNVAVHLADCVAGTPTRLVVVGGAGSLFVNPEHTVTVDQGPDFPEDWKPLSAAHGAALANLRERTNVEWTYVSPAADFQADGERTGEYTLAGEELALNAAGQSTVSYADYAIAIVDLLESGEHVRERVSVVSK